MTRFKVTRIYEDLPSSTRRGASNTLAVIGSVRPICAKGKGGVPCVAQRAEDRSDVEIDRIVVSRQRILLQTMRSKASRCAAVAPPVRNVVGAENVVRAGGGGFGLSSRSGAVGRFSARRRPRLAMMAGCVVPVRVSGGVEYVRCTAPASDERSGEGCGDSGVASSCATRRC